jgi:hypothetical protein
MAEKLQESAEGSKSPKEVVIGISDFPIATCKSSGGRNIDDSPSRRDKDTREGRG